MCVCAVDVGVVSDSGAAAVIPVNDEVLVYGRTPAEVLAIVYLGGASKGGFLPNGEFLAFRKPERATCGLLVTCMHGRTPAGGASKGGFLPNCVFMLACLCGLVCYQLRGHLLRSTSPAGQDSSSSLSLLCAARVCLRVRTQVQTRTACSTNTWHSSSLR